MESDQDLEALLERLQDWEPTVRHGRVGANGVQIPDEVMNHFLSRTGFQCPDPLV